MRPESSSPSPSPSTSTTTSPSGKRSRDADDEVYLDNPRSQKRYLSEMMASSLNGLSVGDRLHVHDSFMECPGSFLYLRDELPLEYSPMSEDESPVPDSQPTSPVSPYRYQKSFSVLSSYGIACTQPPRPHHHRGSDSESRFPSSPSDICHSGDLRRAALLRSVQMRTQPSVPPSATPTIQVEDRPCPFIESLVDDGAVYQAVKDCSSGTHSCKAVEDRSSMALSCKALAKDDESIN